MGLVSEYLKFIYDSCDCSLSGKRMLELGYQDIIDSPEIPEKTGTEYYRNRGVTVYSVDLYDVRCPYRFDLRKPLPLGKNSFDIVTNSGTSEHIEPKEGQYQCFKNIHDYLKVGGVAVHLVPYIFTLMVEGAWENHCNYYYSDAFVLMLSVENGYEVIDKKIINKLLCFSLRKKRDNEFMVDKSKFLRYIDERRMR